MKRKSQVEKFNAKYAKARLDEEAVTVKKSKPVTLERRGEIAAASNGMNTEEIFAIIGRNSVEPFVKMWNNSMENVVRDSMRTEIKEIVREVIREELVSAFNGLIRGMSCSNETEIEKQVEAQVETKAEEQEIEKPVVTMPKDEKQRKFYNELDEAIITQHERGTNIYIGKIFKSTSSRNNTLYQKFLYHHKGVKGAWSTYIDYVLANK